MKFLDFTQSIPFEQVVNIEGKEFLFSFHWRKTDDVVLCDLSTATGETIVIDEELRYGMPLFFRHIPDSNGNINQKFPQKLILPITENGEYLRLGIESLFKEITLVLVDVEVAKTRISGLL